MLGGLWVTAGFPIVGSPVRADFQGLELFAAGPACVRQTGPEIRWVRIPGGTNVVGSRAGGTGGAPRVVVMPAFELAATETTVGSYVRYLNEAGETVASPAVERVEGVWRAKGRLDQPITHVTREEAARYAEWVSRTQGRKVRLPTGDEWEYAARAGADGAPYPWGWATPEGRAVYKLDGAGPVGQFAPNRWGLFDMAGNVAEWCGEADQACGGSWADRSEGALRLHRRPVFPPAYRDADVGFRLLRERPAKIQIEQRDRSARPGLPS